MFVFICLADWEGYANIPTKRSKFTLFCQVNKAKLYFKGSITNHVGNIAFNNRYKLQFDGTSPPNPLPHRGGG